MKKSKYNQIVYYEKQNKWYIHNLMNDCYLELNEAEKNAYEAEKYDDLSSALYSKLCEEGYLTEADELKLLMTKTEAAVNDTTGKHLKLVICPTMGCNFACPYCVETGQVHSGKMSAETMNYLMRFFDRLMDKISPEFVSVVWYGGEPLLCVDEIETLSKHFMIICKIKKAMYHSSVTTNGYLLNESTIDKLNNVKVISYRITVDGPERIHNLTRICKNNEGSYQTIYNNLKILCAKGINTEVRCNVSRSNIDAIPELEAEIEKLKGIKNSNINLHFARMMVYRDVPVEQQKLALTEKEYSDFYTKKEDYKKDGIAAPILYPCAACERNSFVIDEKGNIYKCNSYLGNEDYVLGNVSDLPDVDDLFNHPCSKSIRELTFPKKKACQDCFLLPVCLGSCPINNEKRCNPYKHHPEQILIDKLEREGK